MRASREELLKALESANPGLSTREVVEQSSCYVFKDGRVYTFNDEVFCSVKSPVNLTGAVKAKPVVNLLSKMDDEEVNVEFSENELRVNGKRLKSGIPMEAETRLPVESVEIPTEWRKLPDQFDDAVDLVAACAHKDPSEFVMSCVHITPEWIEAVDFSQIARCPMKMGVSENILVRATSIKMVVGYGMSEVAEDSSWIHFRNKEGLIVSCRRFLDQFKEGLDEFLSADGSEKLVLPGGIGELVGRAEIFTSDTTDSGSVLVDLRKDWMVIEGRGANGWCLQRKKVAFEGDPIKFWMAPRLLVELADKGNECRVSERRLFIDAGSFKYAASTMEPSK